MGENVSEQITQNIEEIKEKFSNICDYVRTLKEHIAESITKEDLQLTKTNGLMDELRSTHEQILAAQKQEFTAKTSVAEKESENTLETYKTQIRNIENQLSDLEDNRQQDIILNEKQQVTLQNNAQAIQGKLNKANLEYKRIIDEMKGETDRQLHEAMQQQAGKQEERKKRLTEEAEKIQSELKATIKENETSYTESIRASGDQNRIEMEAALAAAALASAAAAELELSTAQSGYQTDKASVEDSAEARVRDALKLKEDSEQRIQELGIQQSENEEKIKALGVAALAMEQNHKTELSSKIQALNGSLTAENQSNLEDAMRMVNIAHAEQIKTITLKHQETLNKIKTELNGIGNCADEARLTLKSPVKPDGGKRKSSRPYKRRTKPKNTRKRRRSRKSRRYR